VRRDAERHQVALARALALDLLAQLRELLARRARVRPEHLLVDDAAQARATERAHAGRGRVARVAHTRHAGARRLDRAPRRRDVAVFQRHPLVARDGEFAQPGEEVALLAFEVAAHRRQFQVRVAVDEAR
jgi:hypothetical protein